ncbi:unnamed protein product [Linum tenue]|uniref:Uncharacterized protein n=1 Tax=Linum tenue TaxID=586396 RepID=A0AAV0KU31_9ROSI|nr:unnamed protein product [Linum tenue]
MELNLHHTAAGSSRPGCSYKVIPVIYWPLAETSYTFEATKHS